MKLAVRNLSDGKLDIMAQKLDPNATFDVLVDGVLVGQFTTNGGGTGRIRFRSRPRSSHDELLGFDPRGALVVIRNAAGQDVLAVQLADGGAVGGGDVICCIPDDQGPECEEATAPAQQTIGDEVEFDFDSDAGDIAAGATAIAADFIQGTPPQVTGAILTLGGSVVVEATVDCVVN